MADDDKRELISGIANALRDAVQELQNRNHQQRGEPLLVSIDEAAHMLRVSPRTIEALVDEGLLRSKDVRRKRRIQVKSLREFAERP
jgi:excisionase family DNA binding protein